VKASEVTVEWLRSLHYRVGAVNAEPAIEGVRHRRLAPIVDGRGEVTELWSQPWDGFGPPAHVYQSATDHGVVKCWHLHDVHTDQFLVTRGKVQVSLVDVRPESGSLGQVDRFVLGSLNPGLVRIPPGLLHGWKALSGPEVIVVNLQSHVYDPADEFKFPWDCVLARTWEPRNG
jgi:dTDP-4-dehydrorhamnose 3,5-epimerase